MQKNILFVKRCNSNVCCLHCMVFKITDRCKSVAVRNPLTTHSRSQAEHMKALLVYAPVPSVHSAGSLALWHLNCFDVHRGHLWDPDWWVSITAMSQWRQLPWVRPQLLVHLPARFPRTPMRNQHWRVPRAAVPERGSVCRRGERVSDPGSRRK